MTVSSIIAPGGPIGDGRPLAERGAYKTIDLARALAASAVVWNHCFNLVLQTAHPTGLLFHSIAISASFGRDAVMVFFVISGYWISKSVERDIHADRWSWSNFLVNRLSRLWIVLIPALLIGLLLDVTGRFVLVNPIYVDLKWLDYKGYDVATRLGGLYLVGNMLFLQDIFVPALGTNSPLWTIALEFWYYIWFPTLFLCARGKIPWAALAITALTMYFAPNATFLFPCWLMGFAVARAERWLAQAAPIRRGRRQKAIVTLCCAVAYVAISAYSRKVGMNYYLSCFMVSASFSVLLVSVLYFDVGIPAILNRVADFGAHASFSLYCYHMPVLVAVFALILGGEALSLSLAHLPVAMLAAASLIVGAMLFSQFTERRTDWLRPRFRRLIAWRPGRLGPVRN